jgi:hypothetical protein
VRSREAELSNLEASVRSREAELSARYGATSLKPD